MEGLGSFLLFAAFFYIMMRFGCGAHMIHGHANHAEGHSSDGEKFIDPVCGTEVGTDKGYGVMYQANLYRFCSKKCLDQFDEQPLLFIHKDIKKADHE